MDAKVIHLALIAIMIGWLPIAVGLLYAENHYQQIPAWKFTLLSLCLAFGFNSLFFKRIAQWICVKKRSILQR